jgi:hypothetical protein
MRWGTLQRDVQAAKSLFADAKKAALDLLADLLPSLGAGIAANFAQLLAVRPAGLVATDAAAHFPDPAPPISIRPPGAVLRPRQQTQRQRSIGGAGRRLQCPDCGTGPPLPQLLRRTRPARHPPCWPHPPAGSLTGRPEQQAGQAPTAL